MLGSVPPDVYTARDIAHAAGVPETRVLQLVARGEIRSIAAQLPIAADPDLAWFVAHDEAVRAVRALKQGSTVGVAGALGLGRELFSQGLRAERATTLPMIVSTSLHVVAIASILFIASLGFAVADERTEPIKEPEPIPKPPDPPKPLDAKPVNAPMPTKPADVETKDGLMAKVPETKPSQGSGTGGLDRKSVV